MSNNIKWQVRCPRCVLSPRLCICSEIRQVQNRIPFTLILPWSEYWRLSNTGRLAQMSLAHCETLLRGKPGDPPISSEAQGLLLFPGPGTPILTPELLKEHHRLFIPDGTWREARKIARRTDFLLRMKRVQLPAGLQSRYRLRKSPRPGGVSTLEAIAYALDILHDKTASRVLFELFEKFVDRLTEVKPPVRRRAIVDIVAPA